MTSEAIPSTIAGSDILNQNVSGADGLDAIRVIVSAAPRHLVPGGWLLLEHGLEQGAAIRALLGRAGFVDIETVQDLEQRERVTLGRLLA